MGVGSLMALLELELECEGRLRESAAVWMVFQYWIF